MNLNKFKQTFEQHAKETLELVQLSGAIYAFGSELAVLRLDKVYREFGDRVDSGFSENLKSWYFRLETL